MFRLVLFIQLFAISCTSVFAAEPIPKAHQSMKADEKGYTVNFKDVSIIELVKFIGKIGNVNFIYQEADLDFNVTFTSEEPTSLFNIMSAFTQILRIHELNIIEDDNNLLIHKNEGVKKIPTIVSQQTPLEKGDDPIIVTRVFNIHNANPSNLQTILTPLLSSSALITVSQDTRQMIITDTTANIAQVAELLTILDTPKSSLDVSIYKSKNANAIQLTPLLTEIIMPLSEGNPVIIVPQKETNSVFLVSTPYLLEKCNMILSELDTYSSLQDRTLSADNILVYKLKYRSPKSIEGALAQVSKEAQEQGFLVSGILESIKTVTYIKETNSLLFIGNSNSLDRLNVLLETLDIPSKPHEQSENSQFYIYEPQNKSVEQIEGYLKDMQKHLEESHLADPNMLHMLSKMRVIKDSNSIVFTGDAQSIGEIKQLLKSLDLSEFHNKDEYFIYTPVNLTPEILLQSIKQVADRLSKAGLADASLVDALKDAKYANHSHAIIFTGTKETIAKVKGLMNELDHTDKKNLSDQNMLIYQVKYANPSDLEKSLDKFADSLPLESPIHEAIESATWMPEAHSYVFRGTSDALTKIKELLTLSDSSEYAQDSLFTYRLKYVSHEVVMQDLSAYADQLSHKDPTYKAIKKAKWVPDSNLFIFRGPKASITKITDLLNIADTQNAALPEGRKQAYVVVNLVNTSGEAIKHDLNKIADRLKEDKGQNQSLIDTLSQIEWVSSTNSLFISGPEEDIKQVETFVAKFDVPQKAQVYAMVKLENISGEDAIKELQSATRKLSKDDFNNTSLQQTIDSIEWVKSSNSLFIAGSTADVQEVEKIIKGLDSSETLKTKAHSDFLVYQPQNLSPDGFEKAVRKLAHDLKDTNLSDPVLIESLDNNRYNSETQSFVFTGPPATLTRVKELLAKIDLNRNKSTNTQFFIYKPTNMNDKEFEATIENVTKEFEKTDFANQALLNTLKSMRYVKTTHSFLFTTDKTTLTALQSLLQDLDKVQAGADRNTKFLIYHPEHLPVDELAKSLETVIKDLKKSDYADRHFLDTLSSMRVVEATHSIMFTGTPTTLPQVSELLAKVDIQTNEGHGKTQFIIVRPQKVSTKQVEDALDHISQDLEKSGLANPGFLSTLKSMRYVKTTDSLVFTGDEASLTKIKELVTEVEQEISLKVGIQKVGKTTFLVYKIKLANPEYLESSLQHVAHDLGKSSNPDRGLIKTIDDMRYVKDSNSIIFTGTESTLKKVQELLIQFDNAIGAKKQRKGAEKYLMYKPQHVKGQELIHLTKDFEQNLVNSGVHEPNLFDTINNLKWMTKTGQILVSGDTASTEKVRTLLEKFDVEKTAIASGDHSIETIEDVSFLIYKVQFHKGEEIQGVLQGIAADLKKNQTNKASVGLVKAIESLQFLKVTNSLVATGDPKALIRVKELLESVDIPLRQVFIEILVIETELTGRFEFGLRWGGQGVYKDRLAFSANNRPVPDTLGFNDLVSQVNATNPPLGTDLPHPTGGSLGMIGDLIFHKGKTYFSLGDFVNALQTDDDSTLILNQKLITQDNLNSTLFVGENVPYNGSVVTNQAQTTTISSNIEYRDIGIMLSLTPHIGDDDIVSIEVDQSITEDLTSGSSGGSTNTVFGIKTRKTKTQTKVHVPNKHFVAISGQIRNSTARVKTAIPCLGGLPIIGAAFSDSHDTKNNANVIMFIRPVVVDTYEEYKKLTDRQTDLYREQGITEDFDNGMELIQSPDDDD